MPDLRDMIEDAYLTLSQQLGASPALLREAVLELAGHDAGTTFGSDREELEVIGQLTEGIRDGSLQASRLSEEDAPGEIMRLAQSYEGVDGIAFDQRKVLAGADRPQPAAARPQRPPVSLTAGQRAEQDRLAALASELAGGPSRPRYGSAGNSPAAGADASRRADPAALSAGSGIPGLSPTALKVIAACQALAPEHFAPSVADEVRLAGGVRYAAPRRQQAVTHDVSEDPTDAAQPREGGKPYRRSIEAIVADNPDLFYQPGQPVPGAVRINPHSTRSAQP